MAKYTDPKVIAEEVEYTGGGCDYLVYQISLQEDGERSVIYAFEYLDDHKIGFRRTGILDPCCDEFNRDDGTDWCFTPEEERELQECDCLKEICEELHQRTEHFRKSALSHFERKYPDRKYRYDPALVYFDRETKTRFTGVFEVMIKGRNIVYGYRLDEKGETDYSRARVFHSKKEETR